MPIAWSHTKEHDVGVNVYPSYVGLVSYPRRWLATGWRAPVRMLVMTCNGVITHTTTSLRAVDSKGGPGVNRWG